MKRRLSMLLAAILATSGQAFAAVEGPFDGTVHAFRSSQINAPVIANVERIEVEEGQRVNEGDVLCRLDESVAKASYDLALLQSEDDTPLKASRLRLAQAKRGLDRAKELLEEDTISPAELEDAQYAYDMADADVQRKAYDLTRLVAGAVLSKARLDQYTLRAPFSGIIAEKFVEIGEATYPLDKRLFHLIDISKVYVEAHPNVSVLKKVRVGMPAVVTTPLYPDRRFSATVTYISPALDTGGEWFGFKVLVENDEGLLKHAMRVSVTLAGETAAAAVDEKAKEKPE